MGLNFNPFSLPLGTDIFCSDNKGIYIIFYDSNYLWLNSELTSSLHWFYFAFIGFPTLTLRPVKNGVIPSEITLDMAGCSQHLGNRSDVLDTLMLSMKESSHICNLEPLQEVGQRQRIFFNNATKGR